jgi:hypothetical protein
LSRYRVYEKRKIKRVWKCYRKGWENNVLQREKEKSICLKGKWEIIIIVASEGVKYSFLKIII